MDKTHYKFDGTTPLTLFLIQFITCTNYNRWDPDNKAAHLRVSLRDNAAYVIEDEALNEASYEKLVAKLQRRFGTEGQDALYRSQLRTRHRQKDESLQTLYHDIKR